MRSKLGSALLSVVLMCGSMTLAVATIAAPVAKGKQRPVAQQQLKAKPSAPQARQSKANVKSAARQSANPAASTHKASAKLAEKQAKGTTRTLTKAQASATKRVKKKLAATASSRPEKSITKSKSRARLAKHAEKFSRSTKRVARSRFPQRALTQAADPWEVSQNLAVNSASALVFDQTTGNAIYQKNANEITPIASITKLMTAMVVLDNAPNLQALISISEDDVDSLRGSRSRLPVGLSISRETALLLALMSSENRAAHALARHHPGGMPAFITAMNAKAKALGMDRTRFDDPTGLSSGNVSTAHDLARMVAAAYRYPLIRAWSTTAEASVDVGGQALVFRNTNPLVSHSDWAVGLSKTGYIHEAGRCLVMQAWLTDKPTVIVLLDSAGKLTRVGDANRIKRWMEYTQSRAQRDAAHALAASDNAS